MTVLHHPHTKHALAGLVLAAGGSTRLGEPKQLLQWRGEALICHVVRVLAPLCDGGIVVVTGAEQRAVEQAISRCQLPRVRCVYNPHWANGMAGSLAAGLAELRRHALAAVLVSPGDLPLLGGDDIEALRSAWLHSPDAPAAAAYNGTVGAPAIFPAGCFDALAGLTGDAGARMLLMDNAAVNPVPMPNAALDIDTAADVAKLQTRDQQNINKK